MTVYLVSNNLLLDGLSYDGDTNLENLRMLRPLSFEGEYVAKKISENDIFKDIERIYSSFYSSAICSAKYLASKLNLEITLSNKFNDCKVGVLGSKNMKMVKGLQDHDFNYKLSGGESLNNVGERMLLGFEMLINRDEDVVIFTHKRAILGFLLKNANIGYNLDDNLILEYNGGQIYDDSDSECDIYKVEFNKNDLVNISKV